MSDDLEKSGSHPKVAVGEGSALRLVVTGLLLVSIGNFMSGAATFGSSNITGMVGACISLLGGSMAFAAWIHLWRK